MPMLPTQPTLPTLGDDYYCYDNDYGQSVPLYTALFICFVQKKGTDMATNWSVAHRLITDLAIQLA